MLKQNPASDDILVLRHALTDPLERVRAIEQHDTVVQFLATAIVALHDVLYKLAASSVQGKRSAPTPMLFPRMISYVFSPSAPSEVDLGSGLQSEAMWSNFPMLAPAAADPAIAAG